LTPPDDLIARIASAGANEAANLVLSLPGPQIRAVLAALGPAQAARLLVAVRVDRTADLLAGIGPALLPAVLTHLPMRQVADVISQVPFDLALYVVGQLSQHALDELLLELPTQQRSALQSALGPRQASSAGADDYLRRVEGSLGRIASRVAWVNAQAGILVAEVFGRPMQVAVRYRPAGTLSDEDLNALVRAVDWRAVTALLVLTNASASPQLSTAMRELVRLGYPVEVLTWADERDDGELKRTLVRLSR
jgi:hypothetical protein